MTSNLDNLKELLTVNLFASIIESNNLIPDDEFAITNLEIISDIGCGENFVSKILKATATITLMECNEVTHISFIVKHIGSGSGTLDDGMIEKMNVFEKEIEMYRNIVPALEQIWLEETGLDISFGPKLYYVARVPEKVFIFENLQMSNHKMMNRLDGLNETQVLLVLEKLAKWHAASRIYYDRHSLSPIFDSGIFKPSLFEFIEEHYDLYYANLYDHLARLGMDAHYLKIIKSWEGKICSTNANIQKAHPDEFNVLNHGDLWINNLMFTGDSVKLIDYQLGVYASPVLDLLYFLIMSVNHKLLISQFDNFIVFYHRNLVESLDRLCYDDKIPTLKQFWIDILKKSFFGCTVATEGIPSILLDHTHDGIDYSKAELNDEDGYETRKQMFESARVTQALEAIIPFFGKRGMLEI